MADPVGFGGLHAFASRNFRLYFSGALLAHLGLWLQRIATGWLAWELTGSGAWLGVIAAADLLPTVAFGPVGGALADRYSRRNLVIGLHGLIALQAGGLALLTALGQLDIILLTLLVTVRGIAGALMQPVRMSLIPGLVPPPDLRGALAIHAASFHGSMLAGPALAIPVLRADVAWAFVIHALAALLFVALLSRMRLPPRVRTSGPPDLLRQIRIGLGYVWRHPPILAALLTAGLLGCTLRSAIEMLPAFADRGFGGGAGLFSLFTAATGLGAFSAALWLGWQGNRGDPARRARMGGMVLCAAVLIFVNAGHAVVAMLALCAAGAGAATFGINNQVMVQQTVPDAMRGRVLGLLGVVMRVSPALGVLVLGAASDRFGLVVPFTVAGLSGLAGLLWLAARGARQAGSGKTDAPDKTDTDKTDTREQA